MHQAFGTVVWVVCIIAAIVAVITLVLSGRTWAEHGKGGLVMDHDAPEGPPPGSRAAIAERDAEIRAMIEARNARRARRGEELLDVDEEIQRLTAPPPPASARPEDAAGVDTPFVDPELREEVRQLVVARNNRRRRAGKPELDVEAEVARELRKVRDL